MEQHLNSRNGRMFVDVRKSDSAGEFLAALEAIPLEDGASAPEFRSPWVFRGQPDAQMELMPSAWRQKGQELLRPIKDRLRPELERLLTRSNSGLEIEYKLQTAAEVSVVGQFCRLADELGLEVPDGHLVLDDCRAVELLATGGLATIAMERTPSLELHVDTPFALAQHHGIPTRYLDWTTNPLTAAFFASIDASRSPVAGADGEISVWAVKVSGPRLGSIRWVRVPRSRHHYLHAQDGLFSVDLAAESFHFNANGHWPTFPEFHRWAMPGSDKLPFTVRQYVLPKAQALSLVQKLHLMRVSQAHLMPTFDLVAKTVASTWAW